MSLDPGLRPALVSHVWSLRAIEEHSNSKLVILHLISPPLERLVFYTLNFIFTFDYDITAFLSRPTAHQLISTLPVVCTCAWLVITSLFSCSLSLPSISMLRWIEDINRELQEDSSLQYCRQLLVYLWRERDQNTCSVQVSSVFFPVVVLLISFLCSRPFLKCQTGNEH